MTSKWPEVSLADIYDIRSGLSKPASAFGSGYPFLSFKEVFGNYFVPEELAQLVESSEKERVNGSIKRGDVFLTRTSETMHELGMSSVALKDYENATFNGFTKRLRPKKGTSYEVHPEFVAYYFRSPRFRTSMLAFSTLSTRASLNNDMISRLTLPLPPIKEQKRIANILKCLDDKASVNTSTNQILEEMAQAIFKSWFVDFDPVKAKMNGEQPEGIDATTASLFPEKLVESELGLIPDGWEVKPFSEWVKITKGKNITKKTIVEGDVPVVAGGLKPAYFHNAHNVNGPAITISASGANAGYVNLYFENIWASDCSYISQSTTPLFFLQYVALRYNQKKIFDMQTGAAQPHIYPRDFERLMVAVPNEELCRKLEDVFASFFGTIANNEQQNIELAALRDTLLPKLLSGEIELGQAQELAEVE